MQRMRSRIAAAAQGLAFARTGNWFVSKIPPLLAVAYLEILRFGIKPQPAARLLGCGLFSIFSIAIYGHVVNDIFDLEADRLANKVNRLAAMGPVSRALLAGAFLAAGFLPALMARYSIGVLLLLTLNYLWPTIYSVPITRLKEKDLFGVACDALGRMLLRLCSSWPCSRWQPRTDHRPVGATFPWWQPCGRGYLG